MLSQQEKAYKLRKKYPGRIVCVLTRDAQPHSLPQLLQCLTQNKTKRIKSVQCCASESMLYQQITTLYDDQPVSIIHLPFHQTKQLTWLMPEVVILGVWGDNLLTSNQEIFDILTVLSQHQGVHVVLCHDRLQDDTLQLAAGLKQLHTFGKNHSAKLRLLSNRIIHTGQQVIVKSGTSIKMYRLPVTDVDSMYGVLACLSTLHALGITQAISFSAIPVSLYYSPKVPTASLQDTVGVLCYETFGKPLASTLSANHLGRVVFLTEQLKKYDVRLFVYSPARVNIEKQLAYGYFYYKKRLYPDAIPIPKVNLNLMRSQSFVFRHKTIPKRTVKQLIQYGCEFYPNMPVTQLTGDKYRTYQLFNLFDPAIQPYTELYYHDEQQIERLLAMSGCVFLKPSRGNNGQDIVTIKCVDDQYVVKHYDDEKIKTMQCDSLQSLMDYIKKWVHHHSYIIQQGILSARHHDAVFDVRVLLANDGRDWHCRHKIRCAPAGSDLSNYSQGGQFDNTEGVLVSCFGKEGANQVLKGLYETSRRMVKFLECFYDLPLAEMTFDYVVDEKQRFYLLETNAKPGLFIQNQPKKPFDFTPTPEQHYHDFVMPHISNLSTFFLKQWQRYNSRHPAITLTDLKQGISLSKDQHNYMRHMAWQYLKGKEDDSEVGDLLRDKAPRCVLCSVNDGQGHYCDAVGFGRGIVDALKQSVKQLYAQYQCGVTLQSLHIEVIHAVVFSGVLDISTGLKGYQPEYGIAFGDDGVLCFSSRQLQRDLWLDPQGQFDFNKAMKACASHPVRNEAMRRLKKRPVTKVFYFTT